MYSHQDMEKKSIIVWSDLTEVSYQAALYGFELAKKWNSRLRLFHLLEASPPGQKEEKMRALEAWARRLREEAGKEGETMPEIDLVLEEGSMEDGLDQCRRDESVQLLVAGASDGKNRPGYLFGAKVRRLMEQVSVPILVISEGLSYIAPARLLYVSDIRNANLEAIRKVVQFARMLKAHFLFAHVGVGGLPELDYQAAVSIFQQEVSSQVSYPLRYLHQSAQGQVHEEIRRLIAEEDGTMLAFPKKKYHFFHEILTAEPSPGAAIYKQVPLLIMP